MRLLPLLLLLAACASPGAEIPTPPNTTTAAATTPTVTADSLVDEPMEGVQIAIAFPSITGADAANRTISGIVRSFVGDVQPDAGPPPDMPYDSYEIGGDFETEYVGESLYSGVIASYVFTGGAHGITYFVPLVVDVSTGEAYDFDDLVADASQARATLSPMVHRALVRDLAPRLETSEAEADRTVRSFNGDAEFALGPSPTVALGADSLIVYIAPYEALFYAAGSFRIALPYAAAPDVWKPTGPISRVWKR